VGQSDFHRVDKGLIRKSIWRSGELTRLENNRQLYDYLAAIGATLNTRGAVDLGHIVLAASRTAAGMPVTEFLGESRIALRRVENEQNVLTERERLELIDVLRHLDEAFNRR
jgi:hypothetical protein